MENYNIKESIEKIISLNESDEIRIKDFYSVSILCDKIKLQGKMTSEKIRYYRNNNFEFIVSVQSFLEAEKENIQIIFT